MKKLITLFCIFSAIAITGCNKNEIKKEIKNEPKKEIKNDVKNEIKKEDIKMYKCESSSDKSYSSSIYETVGDEILSLNTTVIQPKQSVPDNFEEISSDLATFYYVDQFVISVYSIRYNSSKGTENPPLWYVRDGKDHVVKADSLKEVIEMNTIVRPDLTCRFID